MKVASFLGIFLAVAMGIFSVSRFETLGDGIAGVISDETALLVSLWPFLIILLVAITLIALATK